MRFRVERDVLAEAVAWTARSLPARPPVPVLAGLLVEAGGDQLTLSSFDYEVSARVDGRRRRSSEAGTVLVSGPAARRDHPRLPARPVTLTTEGTKVPLVCGSARFTLPTLPVEDYPTLPAMPAPTGTLARRRVRRGRRPGRGRGRPRRHAAGAHRGPAGDRRARRSRWPPPTATGSRSASWRGTPEPARRRGRRPGPGPDARRHGEGAGRRATSVSLALASGASARA